MNFIIHNTNENKIAEITSDDIIINNLQDALNLIANFSYQEIIKIILKESNFTPDFYKLRTGIAGEILQKCINYRIKIAITGNFNKYESESFKAFTIECNRGNQFLFAPDASKAIELLSNT